MIFMIVLLMSALWTFNGAPAAPIGPEIQGRIQLGSELTFAPVGAATTVNGIARNQFVTLVAISSDGRMRLRDSVNYTRPWSSTPGCPNQIACLSTYSPTGQRTTYWRDSWRYILNDLRFDTNIQPQMFYDGQGVLQIIASQASPVRRLVQIRIEDSTGSITKRDISVVLPAAPIGISATKLGGIHGLTQFTFIVTAYFADQSFRLFQMSSASASWIERTIVDPGQPQTSNLQPRAVSYGAGNSRGAIFYRSDSVWRAKYYTHSEVGPPTDGGNANFTAFTSTIAPLVGWLPGNYIQAVFADTSGRLTASFGLNSNQNLVLTAGALVAGPAVIDVRIFSRNHDIYVAAAFADRSLKVFRTTPEETRDRLQLIYSGSLPADIVPGTLAPVNFAEETFIALTTSDGIVRWINAHRAAAQFVSDQHRLFNYASPEMGGSAPKDLMAFSSFGTALMALPGAHAAVFAVQPADRCHPNTSPSPLVCGRTFMGWNDYGIYPGPGGAWQTRESALATLSDADPQNDWNIMMLQAGEGWGIFRSAFTGPEYYFHEFMHMLDSDGITGNLMPAFSSYRAEFNVVFGDRTNAALDGHRAMGFVSDYAESNQFEDWAESGSNYRYHGGSFRYLAALDAARDNPRLQIKYDLTKRIMGMREYSNFGTRYYGDDFVPLSMIRTIGGNDFSLTGNAPATARLLDDMNFTFSAAVGGEGWILKNAISGQTTPLRIYRRTQNGDIFVSIATNLNPAQFEDTGLVAGHVFNAPRPNARPIRSFVSASANERRAAASPASVAQLRSEATYTELGIEGYGLIEPFY